MSENQKKQKTADEIVAEFKEKAAKIKAETANTEVISKLCRLFKRAKESVTEIQSKGGLVSILKSQKKMTMEKLVETMKSEGVSSQGVDNYNYFISPVDKYTVLEEDRPKRDEWLDDINAGIQTNTYMITGDETEFLTWLIDAWKREKGERSVLPLSKYGTDVHHSTFSNFVRDTWPTLKKSLPEEKQELPSWINEYHGDEIRMKKKSNKQGE